METKGGESPSEKGQKMLPDFQSRSENHKFSHTHTQGNNNKGHEWTESRKATAKTEASQSNHFSTALDEAHLTSNRKVDLTIAILILPTGHKCLGTQHWISHICRTKRTWHTQREIRGKFGNKLGFIKGINGDYMIYGKVFKKKALKIFKIYIF